jgi:S-adenosylmethionine:tRNA ribosyltransferase-isomerase
MKTFDLKKYDYHLPASLLSATPANPRDSAKLFVYDTKKDKVTIDTFRHLPKYLPKKTLLVFNNTKVVPARLVLRKETGGKVEVLLLLNEYRKNDKFIKGLADRKVSVGQKLFFDKSNLLTVISQKEKIFLFRPNFSRKKLDQLLAQFGHTPIPKYLKNTKLNESALRKRYQSVLAEKPASVAAPTASLHFTPKLLSQIKKTVAQTASVTLHVGLGTFAPIDSTNLKNRKLHEEYYEMSKNNLNKLKRARVLDQTIIAVGTTAVRALESIAAKKRLVGRTELFIFPPYRFKFTQGLITNFHLPKSSLMCLVDAFLREKHARRNITDLYRLAIKKRFRFYSFGDAMLII